MPVDPPVDISFIRKYCAGHSNGREVCIEWRGEMSWAITQDGYCYNKSAGLEYEPMSSSRTDEFLVRCRWFSFMEALRFAKQNVVEK